ncbi:FAD-dependent oxidoreductase [Megalodesulfovibrio gigas]|uniref:Putative pyridine nucleotide-disulfide oxidoreductase family protein n=1 Tax=Megalodesulfovibrio gigas (strain ATCC 19364 / DSM 1382 / NCIMB 9332 / VKM B-1759) TaxID=1121448 RepID=T2G985_MEGG1|nr:FAD-dependent oxidoreductase [Megalodesulfovibrio gigas]AGW12853.1 putative pyridine nucleotide-disulfide oxidoreductase family protein [Megalodesulfovibrio gigas DSM 1382 = ATCC 19364]
MSPFFSKKNDTPAEDAWFLPEDARKALLETFKALRDDVPLEVFTREGENDPYNDFLRKFVRDLGRLDAKIKPVYHTLDSDRARELQVTFSPTLCVVPGKYSLRYLGAPLGEEGRSFIQAILLASSGESHLSATSRQILKQLDEPRQVRVFVNPGCPYCPGQVFNAFKAAVERPDLVRAECVDSAQHTALADEYHISSVPHTIINDELHLLGLEQEEQFLVELVSLQSAQQILGDDEHEHEHDHDHAHHHHPPVEQVDVVIIGSGPAGLTAGIYCVRSGLKTVILEKLVVGGAVAITPVVENYPGFANIPGKKLMDIMAEHARGYCDIREGEEVEEIKLGKQVEIHTNRGIYATRAVLLCTGASWKKIGAVGEDTYSGFGVSYCSSCDGYLYRDRTVAVVGGGNSALTDALHLKNLGADVTIIHRRETFRAQQHLQDSVAKAGIPVLWNKEVLEILGKDNRVTGARLRDTVTAEETSLTLDGVFAAVGVSPNTALAQDLGVQLDEHGFIQVDRSMRTNIPRVYAAGDVTGGVQQIVTAIGEGSVAALSAFEDLAHPYWVQPKR